MQGPGGHEAMSKVSLRSHRSLICFASNIWGTNPWVRATVECARCESPNFGHPELGFGQRVADGVHSLSCGKSSLITLRTDKIW